MAIEAHYHCVEGHLHETTAGTLRSLMASAKAGRMGADVKRAANEGKAFLMCPRTARAQVDALERKD